MCGAPRTMLQHASTSFGNLVNVWIVAETRWIKITSTNQLLNSIFAVAAYEYKMMRSFIDNKALHVRRGTGQFRQISYYPHYRRFRIWPQTRPLLYADMRQISILPFCAREATNTWFIFDTDFLLHQFSKLPILRQERLSRRGLAHPSVHPHLPHRNHHPLRIKFPFPSWGR